MSDFVSKDLLPELWDELLQRHWHFLDTEEGIPKIEERKKLECCLKEFLCVVRHDRKFFLPETAQVLKQSVRELDDFTAYKAIVGFEAVSQYANNLFTKPWRKEFRILKTYSGFYQHEIKSNLVNAVTLFEAMGYRRLSDDILVLDGPICPDQVTNVSRDAMAAYVECQIMKNIYAGLAAASIKCTWQDIFHYREKYVGGTKQAIKDLAYAIQERRHHKEKLLTMTSGSDNNAYATIQHMSAGQLVAPPPPPPPIRTHCQSCSPFYHDFVPTTQQPCALHGNPQMQNTCALHPTKVSLMCNGSSGIAGNSSSGKMYTSYPTAAGHCHSRAQAQPTATGTAHMSHSRSLEHYNEPPPLLPHRHSFDHQQQGCSSHYTGHYQVPRTHAQYAPQHLYESPYDCIDGGGVGLQGDDSMDGSSVSYAAVTALNTNPYNVSGNRYPLPPNISNQLNAHYATPAGAVTCNGVSGVYDTYAANENAYATVSKPPTHSCGYHNRQQALQSTRLLNALNANSRSAQANRQQPFPPEQLIDFDDRALLTTHDYHAHQHMQMQKSGDRADRLERDNMYQHSQDQRRLNRAMNGLNPTYAEPKDILCQQRAFSSSDDAYASHLYARPVPRSSRIKEEQSTKKTTDNYLRKMDSMQGYQIDNNRKMTMELGDRCGGGEKLNGGIPRRKLSSHSNERDFSDLSYESAALDDYVTVGHSEHPQRSPTQAVKNQDGVGSFESWNYVFQKLDRSGYTKDLGDRDDLLVQSLDLDSLNLGGAGGAAAVASDGTNPNQNVEKRRAAETKYIDNDEEPKALEKTATLSSSDKRGDNKSTKQARTSSILKTTATSNSTAANGNGIKKPKSSLKPTATTTTTKATAATAAAVDHSKSNGSARSVKRQISSGPTRSTNGKKIPVATQVIVSKPNEWSCRFCTFLNPDTKRVCGMCSHSKDFIEPTVSNTPTCV